MSTSSGKPSGVSAINSGVEAAAKPCWTSSASAAVRLSPHLVMNAQVSSEKMREIQVLWQKALAAQSS